MPLIFVRNDITRMDVDAVVNAANTRLQMGGGVCGAIFNAAGPRELQAACDAIGRISTGDAVITPGFRLRARHVIHTAGPIWEDGYHGEENLLRSCYRKSLQLAAANGLTSIAFPLISSGIYGYPPDRALRVAVSEIRSWLNEEDDGDTTVCMVLFSAEAFTAGNTHFRELLAYVNREIDYDDALDLRRRSLANLPLACSMPEPDDFCYDTAPRAPRTMPADSAPEDARVPFDPARSVRELDKSFHKLLFEHIDRRHLKDSEVYKRANIDRKNFSKIRRGVCPKKSTIMALCIALELTEAEANELLGAAGYTLSRSLRTDVVVTCYLRSGKYDIDDLNQSLFSLNEEVLTGSRYA